MTSYSPELMVWMLEWKNERIRWACLLHWLELELTKPQYYTMISFELLSER